MGRDTVAVVGAMNEEKCIANVVRQLRLAGVGGVVVVCNGCTDGTLQEVLKVRTEADWPLSIVWTKQPLGHDVSRAIGTYTALRRFPGADTLLYVDGDWAGTFAPNLSELLAYQEEVNGDVLSVTWSCLDENSDFGKKVGSWRTALALQDQVPRSALPFVLPMMIHRRTFERVSAKWLSNPGTWFAYCVQSLIHWAAYPDWQLKCVGHLTRSHRHHEDIASRLRFDAETAIDILSGRRPVRGRQSPLTLPARDEPFLHQYAASVSYIDPPR
jgi:hypothetical protein